MQRALVFVIAGLGTLAPVAGLGLVHGSGAARAH